MYKRQARDGVATIVDTAFRATSPTAAAGATAVDVSSNGRVLFDNVTFAGGAGAVDVAITAGSAAQVFSVGEPPAALATEPPAAAVAPLPAGASPFLRRGGAELLAIQEVRTPRALRCSRSALRTPPKESPEVLLRTSAADTIRVTGRLDRAKAARCSCLLYTSPSPRD